MDYFTNHFSKHHFLHAPHQWFLALLVSPIHFLELHYQKRYHLKYEHARKLFFFDLCLMASMLVLTGLTIFWFTYDPTVSNYIKLTITPSANRIQSGDFVSYSIDYKNNSESKLIDANLAIDLPNTFIVNKIDPQNIFSSTTHTFDLGQLNRGANGQIKISGWFYGIPELDDYLVAKLTYRQENRSIFEEKIATIIKTLRGSILQANLTASDKILASGSTLISYQLTNKGQQVLQLITLPLKPNLEFVISPLQLGKGKNENSTWLIDSLAPGESTTLEANLISNISDNNSSVNLNLTPTILVNGQAILQTTLKHTFNVVRPQATFSANWTDNLDKAHPGETKTLNLALTNNGSIDLNDLSLELPIAKDIINTTKLIDINHGVYQNEKFIINKNFNAGLGNLKIGETKNIEFSIPLNSAPIGGTDLSLTLPIRIKALVPGVENGFYENTIVSKPLKIGTSLNLAAELRYYTNEGDQLGRGPLPPQVGKETKYWAMIKITNGTSRIDNLNFSAELPAYVNWTGKNSVSLGKFVAYNTQTRTVSWSSPTLEAHEQAGIYFEISLTPSEAQRGTLPLILQNLKAVGHDDYLDEPLSANANNLDISLSSDSIGAGKGTKVQ